MLLCYLNLRHTSDINTATTTNNNNIQKNKIIHLLLLLGWWVTVWATDMALEQERSGLIVYAVLDLRVTSATVLTMAGVDTTVHIMKTSPSRVIQQSSLIMVS